MSTKGEIVIPKPIETFPEHVLIPQELIAQRMNGLSLQIADDYRGANLMLIGVLTGALTVTSNLLTNLYDYGVTDATVAFITASSYGQEIGTPGQVRLQKTTDFSINDRHVLLVDDIFDTGLSMTAILDLMTIEGPASLKTMALLTKPDRSRVNYRPDYVGFSIPDLWVEGYGMDSFGYGRGNPNIVIGPTHQKP